MSSSIYHQLPTDPNTIDNNNNNNPLLPTSQRKSPNFKRSSSEKLRFILIRLILPILGLSSIFSIVYLLISSNTINPNQLELINKVVCSNDLKNQRSCLRWENLKDAVHNLGLKLNLNSESNDRSSSSSSKCEDPLARPKLKILHLIDKRTSEVLMDRWMIHSHDAVNDSPDLFSEAVLWGPDFEGYNSSMSLVQNIRTNFGSSDHFDAVLVYWNNDQTKFLKIDPKPLFNELSELSRQGRGVVIIDRPHEMRDLRKEEFYRMANVSLVLAPYAYELFEYKKRFGSQALLIHQPHFIKKDTFYHPTTDKKDQEIIIAGDLGAFYPFRARLAEMIRKQVIPGWIRGHPGYEDIKPADERNSKITSERQENQLLEFGRDLGRAKICLVTDSRWGYSVQKYVEAAAAGCLIAGNVPYDRQSSFEKVIVPLSNKDSDEKIIKTLGEWLRDDDRRIKRAKEAQDWVLENFSMRKYSEDVFRNVWNFKEGLRGLVLPYEFEFLPSELPLDG